MNKLDFVSNKKTVEQLGVMLDSNRFPHALILEGDDGLGKKTLARLLAAALVCRSENRPCMSCPQCHKAATGVHPDIIEHTASGGRDSFKVATVREIINDAFMRPNEADCKVYILGNAHGMSPSAQNALLKILEEPPEYAIFILTVQAKSMMLQTVLSRSVVFSLEGADVDEGARYIATHFDNIDRDDAAEALSVFAGNIGKAVESLQQENENALAELCSNLCRALVSDNEYELLTACAAFKNDRQGIADASDFLKNIFRDALVSNGGDLLSGRDDLVELLRKKLTRKRLLNLVGLCDEYKRMAQSNCNNALLITNMCYSMREAIGR